MSQIATPVRVTEDGLLLVRATMPENGCISRNLQREWVVSLRLFSFDRKDTQERFGLSDMDFLKWLKELSRTKSQNRRIAQDLDKKNKLSPPAGWDQTS